MSRSRTGQKSPERKISAAFLEFAEPLLSPLGPRATEAEKLNALQLAFTVWNSVVYDVAEGSDRYVANLRRHIAAAPDPRLPVFVDQLIARKRNQFGDDQRLVGRYEFINVDGEERLRVEARSPTKLIGDPQ